MSRGGRGKVRAAQRVGHRAARAESGSRSRARFSPRARGCWSPTATATASRPCRRASRRSPDRLETIEVDLAEPGGAADGSARLADERLGGLDVLVNNAGLMRQAPVLEIERQADWDELFAVNLRAVFFLTQAVAAADGRARRGRRGLDQPRSTRFGPRHPRPTTTRPRRGSSRSCARLRTSSATCGVRFNCVAPGETVSAEEAAGYTDEDLRADPPLPRSGAAEAGLDGRTSRLGSCCFLASDDASYVNGRRSSPTAVS